MRGLQRKARLAGELPPSSAWSWLAVAWMLLTTVTDLSSPHDVFCYQGTPCKMPHAIVCFLEDELNVLSKWEL